MKHTFTKITRSRFFIYVRVCVSIALLVFLLKIADLEKVKAAIYGARAGLVSLSFFFLLLDRLILMVRLHTLLAAAGAAVPLTELIKTFFVSFFLGNFFPSTLARDFIRVHRLNRYSKNLKTIISATMVDRMSGAFTLALIIGFALATILLSGTLPIGPRSMVISLVFLVMSISLPVVVWHSSSRRLAERLFDRAGFRKKIHALYEAFYFYRGQKETLAKIFALTFLNLICKMFVFYFLFAALGYAVPFIYFLLFMPLAWLAGIVPISVGELGIIEGGIVFLFSRIGIPVELCLAVGILYRTEWLAVTLPGGYIFLAESFSRRSTEVAHETI